VHHRDQTAVPWLLWRHSPGASAASMGCPTIASLRGLGFDPGQQAGEQAVVADQLVPRKFWRHADRR
jgi:hypothetical protein